MAVIGRGFPALAYVKYSTPWQGPRGASDDDTGIAVDAVADISITSADTASGVDSVVTVEIASADTATVSDAASIAASESDTGSGSDAASLAVSTGDTGTAADAGTTSATFTSDDPASGVESVSDISVSAADTSSGADAVLDLTADLSDEEDPFNAFEASIVPFDPSDADTGSATESAEISNNIQDSDSSTGPMIDAVAQLSVSGSGDTGTGTEALGYREFSAVDSGSSADTGNPGPSEADSGALADAVIDFGVSGSPDTGHGNEATTTEVIPAAEVGAAVDAAGPPAASVPGSDVGALDEAVTDIEFPDPPTSLRLEPVTGIDSALQIDVTGDDASGSSAVEAVVINPHVGESGSSVEAVTNIQVSSSDVVLADDSTSGTPLANIVTSADFVSATEATSTSATAPDGADTVSVVDFGLLDRGTPTTRTVTVITELRTSFVGAVDRSTVVVEEVRLSSVAAEDRTYVVPAVPARTLVPAI